MVEDRWSPAEVQTLVGHSNPQVTLALYARSQPGDLPTPFRLVPNVDSLWTPGVQS